MDIQEKSGISVAKDHGVTTAKKFNKMKSKAYFNNTMHWNWKDAFESESAFLERLNTHPKIKKKKIRFVNSIK